MSQTSGSSDRVSGSARDSESESDSESGDRDRDSDIAVLLLFNLNLRLKSHWQLLSSRGSGYVSLNLNHDAHECLLLQYILLHALEPRNSVVLDIRSASDSAV